MRVLSVGPRCHGAAARGQHLGPVHAALLLAAAAPSPSMVRLRGPGVVVVLVMVLRRGTPRVVVVVKRRLVRVVVVRRMRRDVVEVVLAPSELSLVLQLAVLLLLLEVVGRLAGEDGQLFLPLRLGLSV